MSNKGSRLVGLSARAFSSTLSWRRMIKLVEAAGGGVVGIGELHHCAVFLKWGPFQFKVTQKSQ